MASVFTTLDAQVAAFLAVLLVASAIHKAADPVRLATAAARLTSAGPEMGRPLLVAAGAAELALAIGLVEPPTRAIAAVGAALLWAIYAGFIGRALASGRADVDCGCSFGARRAPLDARELSRNAFLIGLAGVTAVGGVGGAPMSALDLPAALGLFCLYLVVDQVGLISAGTAWR